MGDYLFTDSKFIQNLSSEKPGLFKRLWDEVKYFVKSVTPGTKEAKSLNKLEKVFEKAYQDTKKAPESGEVRYSIVELTNGKKYVKADVQVIQGTDTSMWAKQVSDFINKEIRNGADFSVTTDEGDVLTITKDTAYKAGTRNTVRNPDGTYRQMTDSEYATKLNAEIHINELAEVSKKTNKPIQPDTKKHRFAKDGFTYRTAYFEDFDGSYYKITISVGHNGNVSTIYNVGKIEKNTMPYGKIKTVYSGSKADTVFDKETSQLIDAKIPNVTPDSGSVVASMDSISQTSENVNRKNSLSGDGLGDVPIRGDLKISGKDVSIDDIPIRKDIETNNTKAETNNTKTETNNGKDDVLGDDFPIREDIETKAPGNSGIDAEREYLKREYEDKKARIEAEISDKDGFIKAKAKALYDEIRGLKKGIHASRELGYLLDQGYEWKKIKTALINTMNSPSKRVDQNAPMESIVREMINELYEDKAYELVELEAKYKEDIAELEGLEDAIIKNRVRMNISLT